MGPQELDRANILSIDDQTPAVAHWMSLMSLMSLRNCGGVEGLGSQRDVSTAMEQQEQQAD
jgi:hypothetical protein